MKNPNQKTKLPVRKATGKVMGPQDFSGQDSGYPAASPEGEVAQNQDGGVAGLNYQYIPDLSNPERTSKVTVYKATDPKLHSDPSYRPGPGDSREDDTPPMPYVMWPGPHPRGT